MTNNRKIRFPALSVRQTQRLLAGTGSLPLSRATARRIRTSVLQKAAPKSLARNRIRRTLVPIAACLLAIVVFFVAFPKAALAVSEFLGRVFTPSRYMNEDPAERTPVPSIDEALSAAVPQDGDYSIVLLSDFPDAQGYISDRTKGGFAPFQAADWRWLYDIRPEIAEVLYDGNQLIWNTNLFTTSEHVRAFMECFGVESGSKQKIDALMGDVTYTVAGDPTVYDLQVSGHGITPIFDEAALATADHVVLYSDFVLPEKKPLPDGVLTITQTIILYEVDSKGSDSPIAFLHHTFTFDTTKGNTQSAGAQETLIPLSGDVYLSITHKETNPNGMTLNWTIETKKVSLDGVTLRVGYEYLPTGILVRVTIAKKPADWTDDMARGLMFMTWQNTNGDYSSPGVANNLYLNSKLVGEASAPENWGNEELAYILPVFPEQYADIQSVVMKLTLYHYITLVGTNQLEGEMLVIPRNNDINLEADVEGIPLTEITVPLPKS